MDDLRVVFMGTPEFAVASLKKLVEGDINVVGVITAPDKPMGRGKKLGKSAVKSFAEEAGLNILQPTNLKNEVFQEELRSLKADLQIVVAFRMLPETVWSMPPKGTFNLHASLLPNYRGAAPINWAIINGEKETGVTTFFLKHEIDTGNIIFQEKEPIHQDDTVGTLYERLMQTGADLVLKTVLAIADDSFDEQPQLEISEMKAAPKIFRETCEINWEQSATKVYDFIRGLSPYPASWTKLNGKVLKVYKGQIVDENLSPGEVVSDGKRKLVFGCSAGAIQVEDLQLEGKKRMDVAEFLKGYKI